MKGLLSARDVLWLMVFLGTGYNYMIRLNINIAIVSMVKAPVNESLNKEIMTSECFTAATPMNITNDGTKPTDQQEKFDWDEYQQGIILGAYYWTYWAGQIPGGFLSQKYGTKAIFGFSNFGLCLCGFLVPLAATLDYRVLVALRMLQGLIGGLAWPSLHTMVGLWIPPNERSKFITSYMGSSVGAVLIYPMCGFLLDSFDWPVVFYVTSAIGVVWFISWWLWIYDSPEEHPSMSAKERLYIKENLGDTVTKNKPPTPWKAILSSLPMWINIISQWGNLWGLFTLITQSPTYFQFIHGMDIRTTGMLSGIPHIARLIIAYFVSAGCDFLLQHKKLTATNVRKLAISICCLAQGALMFFLAFSGCNYLAAIVLLTLATGCTGAEAAGALGNLVDLSPNYASIMLGISQTVAVIPGMLSPLVVSYFTFQNQTIEQWKKVFLVTTAVTAIPGFISLCFTTSDLQEWNSPDKKMSHELRELEKLHNPSSLEEEKCDLKNHSHA